MQIERLIGLQTSQAFFSSPLSSLRFDHFAAKIDAMSFEPDYLQFYYDETYLIDQVGANFRKTGKLAGADLYSIFLWKSNRAKNRHYDRLKAFVPSGVFQDAADCIADGLFRQSNSKERLKFLMTKWGFYLATASALLTILYPEEFTVYDYRICEQLGIGQNLAQRGFSERLWDEYQKMVTTLIAATPKGLSLREKDRYLTGKSLRLQIEEDCKK